MKYSIQINNFILKINGCIKIQNIKKYDFTVCIDNTILNGHIRHAIDTQNKSNFTVSS